MNPLQPESSLPDAPPRDPFEILGEFDLESTVVDMMARFGSQSKETALIERVFVYDPDFNLVWETQFYEPPRNLREHVKQCALILGLLTILIPEPDRMVAEAPETFEERFRRWQDVTPTLLQLGEIVQPDFPWLFGWARLGVDLLYRTTAPRIVVCDEGLARTARGCWDDGGVIRGHADCLPQSIPDLRDRSDLDDAAIIAAERDLIDRLLDPARAAEIAFGHSPIPMLPEGHSFGSLK